jgi:hypothetical protein
MTQIIECVYRIDFDWLLRHPKLYLMFVQLFSCFFKKQKYFWLLEAFFKNILINIFFYAYKSRKRNKIVWNILKKKISFSVSDGSKKDIIWNNNYVLEILFSRIFMKLMLTSTAYVLFTFLMIRKHQINIKIDIILCVFVWHFWSTTPTHTHNIARTKKLK